MRQYIEHAEGVLMLGLVREFEAVVEASWNVMAHAQKPDFVFRQNGRVHLNRRGRQFSQILAAEVYASAVVMLDTPCSEVVWRVLATHSIRQFPLTSPPVRHCVPLHFNWSLTQIKEAAVSTGLVRKESKTKFKKRNRNIRNLEQDLMTNGHVFEGIQKLRYLGVLINSNFYLYR